MSSKDYYVIEQRRVYTAGALIFGAVLFIFGLASGMWAAMEVMDVLMAIYPVWVVAVIYTGVLTGVGGILLLLGIKYDPDFV